MSNALKSTVENGCVCALSVENWDSSMSSLVSVSVDSRLVAMLRVTTHWTKIYSFLQCVNKMNS